MQKEISRRERHLDEMGDNFRTTDAQLQSCLAFVAVEAKQLQQLDLQVSGIGSCGTLVLLYLLSMLFCELQC